MHLHILGICGTFMGGIAAIASRAGHTVTGCDANVYPPMSTQLEALGLTLVEGYDAGQLDGVAATADVFVVGSKQLFDYPDCCAIILHYDGTVWRGVEGPTGQALFDVWGVAGQTFIVGSGPTILHGTR